MSELADEPVLETGAYACRFKSCHPHHYTDVTVCIGVFCINAKGDIEKKTGEFYEWFSWQKGFVDQAIRQLKASDGAQVCWYFAEETTMEATRKLFNDKGITNIKLIFAPLG